MSKATIGKPVPAFKLDATCGPVNRQALKGEKTVLYFYPKDNTPGCTLEGQDFTASFHEQVHKYLAFLAIALKATRIS